jgi:repressor LexA
LILSRGDNKSQKNAKVLAHRGNELRLAAAAAVAPEEPPAPGEQLLAPGGDAYLLRVRGDSMIGALIADGDYVVIRPQQTARNGDIVVAQVEENAVTLKRFFKEGGRVRLQPANPQYPPQFYDDVRIQGKLIGVIRRLD